jgi:putative SOS response-associated peptidase YedK
LNQTGQVPYDAAVCSNYVAVSHAERLLSFFGVERGRDGPLVDTFPTGLAPFIRLAEDGSGNRIVSDGHFGLLPHFALELAYGKKAYNARSETVDRANSFRESCAKGWRCIIPVEHFFESCWETGKAVRWQIQQHGEVPMGLAGIYRKWRDPQGNEVFTFAMLTVNADAHPVMQRFHRPGDEKRMVIILDRKDYDEWLSCSVKVAPKYFRQWEGALLAAPKPVPGRAQHPRTICSLGCSSWLTPFPKSGCSVRRPARI